MMKGYLISCAILLQLGWISALGPDGVGAFSYQGPGHRYAGTYDIKDGKVVDVKGALPPDFKPPDFKPSDFKPSDFKPPDFAIPDFNPVFIPPDFTPGFPEEPIWNNFNSDFDDGDFNQVFAPAYFKNLDIFLKDSLFNFPSFSPFPRGFPFVRPFFNPQSFFIKPMINPYNMATNMINNMNRAFQANMESQRKAFEAAQAAFDLTANQATSFNPFNKYPGAGSGMRSSFAGASIGPDVNRQAAILTPGNPDSPNVNVVRSGSGNGGGFKQVSVSSYSSSSNINGVQASRQGANTYINDNGKVTSYSVHDP